MHDDDDNEPYKAQARAIAESAKALKVVIKTEDGTREMWVPKSVIHDDSEVYGLPDNAEGKLVLQAWFAREEGSAE